jgi:hypothetical protein
MPDRGPQTIVMNGLAGVTLVSDKNQEDAGALIPRNLEATQTGIEAGIFLSQTPLGAVIEAATANSVYRIVHVAPNTVEISGHPVYCPVPMRVSLTGTRWLDTTLQDCYIAPSMRLQLVDRSGRSVLTSRIRSVQIVSETK